MLTHNSRFHIPRFKKSNVLSLSFSLTAKLIRTAVSGTAGAAAHGLEKTAAGESRPAFVLGRLIISHGHLSSQWMVVFIVFKVIFGSSGTFRSFSHNFFCRTSQKTFFGACLACLLISVHIAIQMQYGRKSDCIQYGPKKALHSSGLGRRLFA